jgi:hypothetical protein
MAYSITTAINDLIGVTHGTTVNKIPNLYGAFNRAARQVLLDVDPKETMRTVTLAQAFNGVYDYAIPVDVKGDRIVDIRPQAGRNGETFTQGYEMNFDLTKDWSFDNQIYTQWNTGVKSLRLSAPFITAPIVLSDTGSLTGWAATTGASTITLDQTNNVAGGGALVFNLLASNATGYIETSSLSAVDFTSYVNNSTGFLWVYFPSGSAVTSVDLRWGSDSSNYYTATATTTQAGLSFQAGWNLLAFPWPSTATGSPTLTSYKYVRVNFNYNSNLQTGVKICNLKFAQGQYLEALYYSKYLFRDPSTNAFQEIVTDINDNNKIINLDTESYNLFFNKLAYFVAQQLQGSDAGWDAAFFDSEYQAALTKYKALNPSEAIMKAETYYKIQKKSYNKFSPGYWIK